MIAFIRRLQRAWVPALLCLSAVTTSFAAPVTSVEIDHGAARSAAPHTVIIGDPLPIDLYPDNCLVSGVPNVPRQPVLQTDIFVLDRSKAGEEQFVSTTVTVWREPCNRERSVLLMQVAVPSGSAVPLQLPELQISACPAYLDGGFALRLDDYSSRAAYLEPGTPSRLFSLAVLGLDTQQRPIDVLPLAECDINLPVTLRFKATSDPMWVEDPGTGVAFLVPGVSRTRSLAIAAFDPALYAETTLQDLLTGHVSGAYFDPNYPGEGIQVEVARVPGGQTLVLAWFTYDDVGNPFWLVGAKSIEPGQRSIELDLESRIGGRFAGLAGTSTPQSLPWGKLSLGFTLCNTLEFSFESTHTSADMPSGSGQRTWSRLTEIAELGCD